MMGLQTQLSEAIAEAEAAWHRDTRTTGTDEHRTLKQAMSDAALKVVADWLDERPLDPAHALSRTIRGE